MTDRLKDLRRGGTTSISIDGAEVNTKPNAGLVANDVEAGNQTKSGTSQFFSDIDMLKKNINLIKENTSKISDLTQETILATSNEKESELSAEVNPIITDTNKKGVYTKKLLQGLKDETSRIELKPQEAKIRDNLLGTLTRKFVEVMKDYQQAQSRYKTEIMKKARRQVQIVKPNATEEEVDAVVRSGGADQLIQASILKGEASESVKSMCESVNQRYNEVMAIEKSVQEMHQMFLDMALIVESQGEVLDSIEFQVQQSLEFIEEGNEQMGQAIQIQKNMWRHRCYFLIFIGILVGIIVLVVKIRSGN
jgi:t-SNARE complex subunit (syntaxin)